jgi:hypothetical protein
MRHVLVTRLPQKEVMNVSVTLNLEHEVQLTAHCQLFLRGSKRLSTILTPQMTTAKFYELENLKKNILCGTLLKVSHTGHSM